MAQRFDSVFVGQSTVYIDKVLFDDGGYIQTNPCYLKTNKTEHLRNIGGPVTLNMIETDISRLLHNFYHYFNNVCVNVEISCPI